MARRQISISIDKLRHRTEMPAGKRMPADDRSCPRCNSHFRAEEMQRNLRVCAACGYHFPVGARERLEQLADGGLWEELWPELRASDPLSFVDLQPYPDRVAKAERGGANEAMVVGEMAIGGHDCISAVMDFTFLGGSMGSVVGEKFARACERAAERHVPLITVTASGGARMQEGVIALMQMAKSIVGLDELHDEAVPFIVVLAHPTTGGVWASFASVGDVTYAEPGALIAFSGPRVIEQTTREKLPPEFGLAETQLLKGQVDAVVDRRQLAGRIGRLMGILERPAEAPATLVAQLTQNGTERAQRVAQALPALSRRIVDGVRGGRADEPASRGGDR